MSVTIFMVELAERKGDHVKYNPIIGDCDYHIPSDGGVDPVVQATVIVYVIILLPILVVIVTTVPILNHLAKARKSARRVQGSIPKQGTLTVFLTAAVFCVSTLPYSIYMAVQVVT
jgi:heme/copper-type cytochrome/quinol oxidase subunit 2